MQMLHAPKINGLNLSGRNSNDDQRSSLRKASVRLCQGENTSFGRRLRRRNPLAEKRERRSSNGTYPVEGMRVGDPLVGHARVRSAAEISRNKRSLLPLDFRRGNRLLSGKM